MPLKKTKAKGMVTTMIILTIFEKGRTNYHLNGVVEETSCKRVVKIGQEAVSFFKTSEAAHSFKVRPRDWNSLSKKKRIECALASIADGNPFTYEEQE